MTNFEKIQVKANMNLNYDDKILLDVDQSNDLMTWIAPQYTKKSVGRAGDTLIDPSSTEDERSQALIILDNWRASHSFPLNSLTTSLRYRANKVTKEAIISQRLKRVPSITGKLARLKTMKLNRMQDIGGCRAIVPTISDVYALRELMINPGVKSELKDEDDYIKNAKPSGYRGIHLIYKYRGKKQDIYDGHLIEVQIRSAIQHAWATSVEIAGTFLGDSLKSGQGSPEWLSFFELASILFSQLESYDTGASNKKEDNAIKEKVVEIANKLSVFEVLKAFSVATTYGNQYDKAGYFLLNLDINEKTVSIEYYSEENLDDATKKYLNLEKKYENTDINVVLVATESVWSLQKAYPNYFADSEFFLETLSKALSGSTN